MRPTQHFSPVNNLPGIDIQFQVTETAVEEGLHCPTVQRYKYSHKSRSTRGKRGTKAHHYVVNTGGHNNVNILVSGGH